MTVSLCGRPGIPILYHYEMESLPCSGNERLHIIIIKLMENSNNQVNLSDISEGESIISREFLGKSATLMNGETGRANSLLSN